MLYAVNAFYTNISFHALSLLFFAFFVALMVCSILNLLGRFVGIEMFLSHQFMILNVSPLTLFHVQPLID